MSYDRTLKYLIEEYPQAIVQWLLNIMQESVVYQKIIREGLKQGRGSEVKLIMRLLQRRLGKIGIEIQNQIQDLSLTQL
jgi:predicted transposase YdaD